MIERELIDRLCANFPRSPAQRNALHKSDAEILELDGSLWALTTDEFSGAEDLFFDACPDLIGWNVVAATVSDLLAVGAEPRFFLQTVTLPHTVEESFVEALTAGVREALREANCFLAGGDVGCAETWRYTGIALGPILCEPPLTRKLPDGRHSLWITGELGGANVAAARRQPPPRIPLRTPQAALIRQLGSACIDTSGGLLDAVWQLHQASPDSEIRLDLEAVPLAQNVAESAKRVGVPPETALVGGAGEYELLFAVPDEQEKRVADRAAELEVTRIGSAESRPDGMVHFTRGGEHVGTMAEPPPCPRAAGTPEVHLAEAARTATRLFGRGGTVGG